MATILLLVGVVLILLRAFDVQFGPADIGWVGVALCFAAGLVGPVTALARREK